MNDELRKAKIEAKALQRTEELAILRDLVKSPLVQILGTVIIAESAEKLGVLSSRWAGALEGGVIAFIALQSYKELGTVGLAGVAGSAAVGAATKEGLTGLVADLGKLISLFAG